MKRQSLMKRNGYSIPTQELCTLSKEIEKAVEQEMSHWQQRAQMTWFKEGDRNTKVFPAQATKTRRKNTISGLFDESGSWHTDDASKAQAISNYFESLFKLPILQLQKSKKSQDAFKSALVVIKLHF